VNDLTEQEVDVVFKASGKTTVFEGFLKAYSEGPDDALPATEGVTCRRT
ncbi:unnamed protein product, partial [Hapterophycus canaliculatus]